MDQITEEQIQLAAVAGGVSGKTLAVAVKLVYSNLKPDWVIVSERLPEKPGSYLVVRKNTGFEGFHFALAAYWPQYGFNSEETHWMPLPEFPNQWSL